MYIQGARLPDPGHYKLEILSQRHGSGSHERFRAAIFRNGWQIGPYIEVGVSIASSTWLILADGTQGGAHGPIKLGISSGDVISIRLWKQDAASYDWAVDQIRLTQLDATDPGSISAPDLQGSDLDLGASSVLIDLRENTAKTTFDCDLCVTANGDVYLLYIEQGGSGGVRGRGLILKKWNGSSWSLISNNVWGRGYPDSTHSVWRCAIATNGTDVFCVWGENPNSGGSTQDGNGVWRCMKWDGASLTELGTGQKAQPGKPADPNYSTPATAGDDDGPALAVKCAPDTGYPWVAWAEKDTNSAAAFVRPYLYHWNGSSWVDTSLPGPATNRGDVGWLTGIVDQDRPWSEIDLTFCHHDGPSNYPAVFFVVEYYTNITDGSGIRREFIYEEYNGSSWTNILRFQAKSVWGYTGADILTASHSNQDIGHWFEGLRLFNDGAFVYLAGPLGYGGASIDILGVAKLRSDGTAFEALGKDAAGPQDAYSGLGSWEASNFGAVATNGKIFVLNQGPNEDGLYVNVYAEDGDTKNWMIASKSNLPLWATNLDCFTEMAASGSTIYIANEVFVNRSGGGVYLGVWKYSFGGPIAVHTLVPLR